MTSLTDTSEAATETPATLSSLAPTPIFNFSPSDTFAIVAMQVAKGKKIEHRRVEIPEQFHACPIFRALLQYFNSGECKNNSPTDAYHRILRFNSLAEWAAIEYPDAKVLPPAVMQDFAHHLRTAKNSKLNTICVYMSVYRTAFDNFLDNAYGNPALAEAAAAVREAIVYIPSVSNRAGQATPSLGQITNQPEKDELKIREVDDPFLLPLSPRDE